MGVAGVGQLLISLVKGVPMNTEKPRLYYAIESISQQIWIPGHSLNQKFPLVPRTRNRADLIKKAGEMVQTSNSSEWVLEW